MDGDISESCGDCWLMSLPFVLLLLMFGCWVLFFECWMCDDCVLGVMFGVGYNRLVLDDIFVWWT